MCEWGDTIKVSINGAAKDIDGCIAPLVKALSGIGTIASCCGHGRMNGNIVLSDNRVLEIHPDFDIWIEKQKGAENVQEG